MKSLIAFALVSLFSIAAQAQIWVGHDGRVVFEVEEAGKHTGYLVVTGEDSPQLAAEGLKPKTEHWCSFESTKGVPSSFDLAPVGDPTTTLKKAGFTLGLWDGRCHEKPRGTLGSSAKPKSGSSVWFKWTGLLLYYPVFG